MSLVTSCPACGTAFHVKPEQLAAHKGDVRCGKCHHVFNAHDRLRDAPEEQEESLPLANESSEDQTLPDITEGPLEEQTPFVVVEGPDDEPEQINLTSDTEFISGTDEVPVADTPVTPAIFEDFDQKHEVGNPAKKAAFRWSRYILAILLLMLAIAQTIYYLRTPIAAKWPALKPYLTQACELIHCDVELPHDVELIAIDDSEIQEDAEYQGLIHLSSTLINQSPYAQAYPLLELSLTDIYDKVILRRIFTPNEYLPAGTDIKSGMGAGEEVHIKLNLTAGGEQVAGYRVLVTYR